MNSADRYVQAMLGAHSFESLPGTPGAMRALLRTVREIDAQEIEDLVGQGNDAWNQALDAVREALELPVAGIPVSEIRNTLADLEKP